MRRPRATQAATQPATTTTTGSNNTLIALWIANSNPPEYVFVLNNTLAYMDLSALELGLADLPAGSTLTWNPSETVIGREPLRDPDDLKAFKKFCEDQKIKLVVAPAK